MQYKDDSKRVTISEEAFNRPEQSQNYGLFRPNYPEFFFTEEVSKVVEELRTASKNDEPLIALDLGCGPGQATFQITKYFDHVIGVDINTKQLSVALEKNADCKQTGKISFISGDCSKIENIWTEKLNKQRIHAIFICQAFHWFNQSDILEQCKKILEPTGGYLFLLGYSKFKILPQSAEFEPYFEEFYSSIHHLFDFDRDVLNNYYKDIDFKKYFEYEKFVLLDQENMNYQIDNFIGYLDTFSAYRNKLEREDNSPDQDSLKILVEKLGFKNYARGKLSQIDYSSGPKTLNFKTPFFMYILKNFHK